jgi:ABC-type Na+ efflux pump permease subunit
MYIARAAYGFALLVLISTAWLVLTGTQMIRDIGDLARFGMALVQILSPLQLAVAVFFSALLAASAVAQEKDRKTLDLLLLTKLSNSELVLGKLLASLLNMLVLLATALPVFMLTMLFGGVSLAQIGRVFGVTLASAVVGGSLGSTLALWREKTFQAISLTMLILVLWLAGWRLVAAGVFGSGWCGLSATSWAVAASPLEAIFEASRPYLRTEPTLVALGLAMDRCLEAIGVRYRLGTLFATPLALFALVSAGLAVVINGWAILRVRVWNPSREAHTFRREDETWHRASIWGPEYDAAKAASSTSAEGEPAAASQPVSPPPPHREVWDNPIIWREMRTWAYGRKILIVRLAYLVLFALVAGSLVWSVSQGELISRGAGAAALAPLFLLSLVLVNAQAVTSMTSERDARALDLLLVSDLTPKEIVYGKLGGVFYNTKEMIALPAVLCIYLCCAGAVSFENLLYLLGGLAVLYAFSSMLGIHAGMHYANSRSAIATSLGTVFFLFLGVATCMWMMIAFSGSFEAQLQPFLAFMVGGGVGLYVALGARNPSPAIGVASFVCPFATFYAITSFFLDYTLGVFLVTAAAYGFATAAMLIPAIYEFDVATGRTTAGE